MVSTSRLSGSGLLLIRSCSSRKHILQSLVNSTALPEAQYPETEACSTYRSGIRRGPKINSGFAASREKVLGITPGLHKVIQQATAGTEQVTIGSIDVQSAPAGFDQVEARTTMGISLGESMEWVEKVYVDSGRMESESRRILLRCVDVDC